MVEEKGVVHSDEYMETISKGDKMITRCVSCDTPFHAGEPVEFCPACHRPVCSGCADEEGLCVDCAEEKRMEEITEEK